MTSPDPNATVIARRDGRVGRITLDRPGALNALDLGMLRSITETLALWRDDPAVHAVVIEGTGGRAFCAGGDVRLLRDAAAAGQHDLIHTFFAAEYGLNQAIAAYPKPCIALIDGVCMGGGIGLAVHGAARVVTEAAVLAMPEAGIGLFPDVGTSYVLPRLRGRYGLWMALTGARLSGADALHVGLATHFTSRGRLAGLGDELARTGVAALAEAALPPPPSPLADHAEAIGHCFGADSVDGILARLAASRTAWADETLAAIGRGSPSAVLWTFELMRLGAGRTLPECLAAELALTRHATRHPDFTEGVRAMVVDKDRQPRWSPAHVRDVPRADIARQFTDACNPGGDRTVRLGNGDSACTA